MNIRSEEAAMLYRIAVEDCKAFRKLIDDTEIDLRIAAFFAQQTVEKLFKAVLAGKMVTFPPTHTYLVVSQHETKDCRSGPRPRSGDAICGRASVGDTVRLHGRLLQ